MITDKVIDGTAYLVCMECGKKTPILLKFINEDNDIRLHSIDRSIDNMQVFRTTHSLCKKEVVQATLDLN